MNPFAAGDKVVCVYRGEWIAVNKFGDVIRAGDLGVLTPVFGVVYTVRAADPDGVLLKEIANRPTGERELSFDFRRFRKAESQGMRSLRKCLTPPREGVKT